MREHITIKQIAEESNVSISTVSRVLNGKVPVAPEKRKRVEEIVQKYGFSPNAMARGLISHQSMTLGIVMPDITNPYFAALFLEIERCAMEAGYSVILCNTLYIGSSQGTFKAKTEANYFQMLMDKHVDGVVVAGGEIDLESVSDGYKHALSRLNDAMPVVMIGEPVDGTGCIFIQRESSAGIVSLVNHLRSLGHERIAFVGGQPGVKITSMRLNAYRSTLGALGLEYDDSLVALSDYYVTDGYNAMKEILERNVFFSAAIAINDAVAIGVQRALADKGMVVPVDVALVSCDQFFTGEYNVPRLTSIEQQNDHLGRMAIMTLISAIKGVAEPVKLSFTPELVIRESCGSYLGVRTFRKTE